MKRPRVILAGLLATLLVGCTAPPVVPASLAEALLGVWCNSDDGGRTCWAWDEFTDRGTLEMCGQAHGDARPFRARATVEWAGARLCYRVVEATDTFWLRAGERYCTEIVEVHPDHHVYRDLDTGQHVHLLRRTARDRHCTADPPG
ncbi:MAG: hypothetical protein RL375_134 [Pseudomonadota bacterium]